MRVAVIGAGIVGVATAYELASDGHEVSVIDRRGGVAAEASFANAGVIAPGYVAPWAAPGMPAKVLGQLWSRHAAVRWHPSLDPAQWRWLARWWRACSKPAYLAHRSALLALATFSQQRLQELRAKHQLEYERGDGLLLLLRGLQDAKRLQSGLALLKESGLAFAELSPEQCRAVEPALDEGTPLHGGIRLPSAEVGNCRQVAHLLRDLAENRHQVDFRFASSVTAIDAGAGRPRLRIEQLALSTGFGVSRAQAQGRLNLAVTAQRAAAAARYTEPVSEEHFDAVVVCAGNGSIELLPSLGLRVPLLPVHGYSATFKVRAPEHAPRSALMDERYKVAISRIGDRVRVAGMAELGGAEQRHHTGAVETLHKVLHDWFPSAVHRARAQIWKGARPMLADGPPLIGASPMPGVWLNLGHGSSGWALACGSARLLADQVGGRLSPIDARPFTCERYRG